LSKLDKSNSKAPYKTNKSMMNTSFFLNQIEQTLSLFERTSLQEMDTVKLMDRVDTKYLIPIHLLPDLLKEAYKDYKCLEIEQSCLSNYQTTYFDTADLLFFHQHQIGRANRYKIRLRAYLDTQESYFEIKHKTNKGRTIKTRIKQNSFSNTSLTARETQFLEKYTPILAKDIQETININYQRMTLVNRQNSERITIDLNLSFNKHFERKEYKKVGVIEIKQAKFASSPMLAILRKYHLKSGSISKYCLGIVSLFPDVKYNRFKPNLLHLQKIIQQYDIFTNDNQSSHT